jgi:DNA primase
MPYIDFSVIKQRVSIRDVCQLIGWKPLRKEPSAWRGQCPFHVSNTGKPSRSFAVDIRGNGFCCQNKRCGVHGDQIRLYALHAGLELYPAALELCRIFDFCVPLKTGTEKGTVKGGSNGTA